MSPASPAVSDAAMSEQLVLRIEAGDVDAEVEFVRQFLPGVRTLVRRHARPRDPAIDDFVQDVLQTTLKALRSGQVRDRQALHAYLRGVVLFTVRADYRRRERQGANRSESFVEDLIDARDPAQIVSMEQTSRLVRQLVGELKLDRDRDVLDRFYLREESKETVCRLLGIDEDHFHRVLFRARQRLRELLEAADMGALR